jgi:hypothetical protein
MANQVVSSYVNFDSPGLSGLNDMESISFSGLSGHLVMDADNRWGQNNAVYSGVVLQGEGKWTVDGTKIWEIPFSNSTGTVPSLSTLDSNPVLGLTSGATGELFRVWSTTQTTPISTSLIPLSSDVTMPTTGYIKLRYKSGTFQAGETIRLPNNSTIVADNAGKRSWINIVARATTNTTVRRQGQCKMTGDWHYLGVTNGNDNQTFQFPTFDACPAIWVETLPNSNVYEIWPNAGYSWDYNESTLGNGLKNSLITTDIRGKYFGMIDPLNGVIQIAKRDGLGNKAGYKPVAGCRVRIPNIILSSSYTVAPYNTNTYTRTLSSEARKHTITFQDFYLDKVSSNWILNTQNCNSVYIKDSSISDNCTFANVQKGVEVINTCISPSYWLDNNANSFSMRYCNNVLLSGLDVFTSGWNPNSYTNKNTVAVISEQENLNIQDCKFVLSIPSEANGTTANGRSMAISQIGNSTLNNIKLVGAVGTVASNCRNILIQNTQYSYTIAASSYDTSSSGFVYEFDSCKDITVDGLNWNNDIKSTIITGTLTRIYNNSDNITFQNFGTYNSPLYTGDGNTISSTERLGWIGEATNSTYSFDSASNIKYIRVYLTGLRSNNNSNTSHGGAIREFSGYPNNVTLQNVHILSGGNVFNPRSRDLTLQGCRGSLPISTFYTNAVYGTQFTDIYTSGTTGTLTLYTGNEPSDTTSPYLSTNILLNEGDGGFTGDGRLLLYTQGHSVIWEMPYYALGYTAFLSGGLTIYGTGGSNYIMEYQYDKGSGFNNVWLPITTGTSSPNLTAINPIDPNVGFKIKLKVTKINGVTNVADLRNIRIPLSATSISQQILYPLPKTHKLIISNLITGTRVQLYNETTNTELFNGLHSLAGDFIYEYNNGTEISTDDIVRIRLTYVNGNTAKLRQEIITQGRDSGIDLYAIQIDDEIYNLHAIDGATVTEFVADYPTIQVDINDPDQITSIPRLYAWWVVNEYTSQGIANYFGGLIAEDLGNYKIMTDVVDLKLDNTRNVGVVFEGDFRLYRDDGAIPVTTTTSGGGSVILYAGRINATRVETRAALTVQQEATLNKINTLPQDTLNLRLSAITDIGSIGARLKNCATVDNVSTIITDTLSI